MEPYGWRDGLVIKFSNWVLRNFLSARCLQALTMVIDEGKEQMDLKLAEKRRGDTGASSGKS